MPAPVTPADLTDEMIAVLQREIAGHVFPASGMAHTGLSELWADTENALGVDPNFYASARAAGRAYRAARQRVCHEINARAGKESK